MLIETQCPGRKDPSEKMEKGGSRVTCLVPVSLSHPGVRRGEYGQWVGGPAQGRQVPRSVPTPWSCLSQGLAAGSLSWLSPSVWERGR